MEERVKRICYDANKEFMKLNKDLTLLYFIDQASYTYELGSGLPDELIIALDRLHHRVKEEICNPELISLDGLTEDEHREYHLVQLPFIIKHIQHEARYRQDVNLCMLTPDNFFAVQRYLKNYRTDDFPHFLTQNNSPVFWYHHLTYDKHDVMRGLRLEVLIKIFPADLIRLIASF